MGVRFAFQPVPPGISIVACAIYMAVAVILPRALIFVSGRGGGSTTVLMSGWGWTILNALIFLRALSLVWQLVIPRWK